MDAQAQQYLDQYLSTLTADERRSIPSVSADYYCADEENANVCAELVRTGKKTATCSMERWYSVEGEQRPQVGHLQVVTNWSGEPVCVIEITDVSTCPFEQVSVEFAQAEGEGDLSIEWWRNAHQRFFSAECEELNIPFSQDTLLLLERFKVVYPV
ncbi:ASCH domain-containing protein [Vibrio paucivorans]